MEWSNRVAMPAIMTNLKDLDGDWRPDEVICVCECQKKYHQFQVTIRIVFRQFKQTNGGTSSAEIFGNFTSIFYALFFDVRLEKRAWIEVEKLDLCVVISTD